MDALILVFVCGCTDALALLFWAMIVSLSLPVPVPVPLPLPLLVPMPTLVDTGLYTSANARRQQLGIWAAPLDPMLELRGLPGRSHRQGPE